MLKYGTLAEIVLGPIEYTLSETFYSASRTHSKPTIFIIRSAKFVTVKAKYKMKVKLRFSLDFFSCEHRVVAFR